MQALKVRVVNYLGKRSPATVNRITGDCFVDKYFLSLPIDYQKFILLHEEGHHKLATTSEHEADNYASAHILGSMPQSAKKSIKALGNVLSFTTPEHRIRLRNQIIRSAIWDYKTNGNKNALKLLESIIKQSSTMNTEENNEYSNWGKRRKFWARAGRYLNLASGALAARDIVKHAQGFDGDINDEDENFDGDENDVLFQFSNFVADTYTDDDGILDQSNFIAEMQTPDENSSFSDFKAFKKLSKWVKKQADKIPFDAIKSVAQFVPVPGLNQALELREKGRNLLAKAKGGDTKAVEELKLVNTQLEMLPADIRDKSAKVENVAAINTGIKPTSLQPSNDVKDVDKGSNKAEKLLGMPKQTAYIVIVSAVVVIAVAAWYFTRKKQ